MTEALTPNHGVFPQDTVFPEGTVTSEGTASSDDVSGSTEVPAAPEAGTVPDVEAAVHAIADRSRHAARRMARANRAWKDRGLRAIGAALLERKGQILAAN